MFKQLNIINSQNAVFCTAVVVAGWLCEAINYKVGLSFGGLYKVLVTKQYTPFYMNVLQLAGWVSLLCCLRLARSLCESILEQLLSMGCSRVMAWTHVGKKFSDSEAAQKIVQDSDTLSKSLVKNIVLYTVSPPAVIWYSIQVIIYGGARPILIIFAVVLISHGVAIFASKYIKKWSKICSSSLSRVRDYSAWANGRAIVVAGGGNLELTHFYRLVEENGYNHMKLGVAEGLFSFWIRACSYLGGVLSYIILGWLIFIQHEDLDVEMMINFNFLVQKLMFLCQGLLTIWDEVARIRGMWQRLCPIFSDKSNPIVNTSSEFCLSWTGCNCTANDLSLSNNWSGIVEFGQVVCIYGPPGVGKTTWVNQIAGLNTRGSFNINTNYMILSGDPVFTIGSFVEQITYPLPRKRRDPLVTNILDKLICLQKFVTKERDWASLSPGEKQWVNIARILYHSPKVLIWDDFGCHFDQALCDIAMEIIEQARVSGNCIVCVANHPLPNMSNFQFGVNI